MISSHNLHTQMSRQSLFAVFLNLLGVKHTKYFTDKTYFEHPYKNTFYGLSDMLSQYNIENIGIRITDKDTVDNIETPFIAHIKDDLVIVSSVDDYSVSLIWDRRRLSIPKDSFIELWTGDIIIAEKNANSCEPDYLSHKKVEKVECINNGALLLLCFLLFFTLLFKKHSVWHLIALLLYVIGTYSSFLLVLKQTKVNDDLSDRICSLFIPSAHCGNLLDGEASKFLGAISWSDVGLGYFISGIITILFFPYLYCYAAILNAFALPFTIWSIRYQFREKQWCSLCILVQLLQWLLFFCNIIGKQFVLSPISFYDVVYLAVVWFCPFLVINVVVWNLERLKRSNDFIYKYNHLRCLNNVFSANLHQQKKYDVSSDISSIIIGHSSSPYTLTVLTNPHCQPCAIMHDRIETMIKNTNIKIQYIFSSFNEDLDESNRIIVSAYQKHPTLARELLIDWFHWGKDHVDEYSKKYECEPNLYEVQEECLRHKNWKKSADISVTPTVLLNGYLLPSEYQIEDLHHIDFNTLELI